jgi:K+-transporting ATPase ATPase C chain
MLPRFLIALRFSVLMMLLCGFLYPCGITALAQTLFPWQANGSLLYSKEHSQAIGSVLLGQTFTGNQYFHSRPAVNTYDAANSGGANLGANSKKLVDRITADVISYKQNFNLSGQIPVDAVTASASSLDPHISLANALQQVPVVARARGINPTELESLVRRVAESSALTETPYLNVLVLNLTLDGTQVSHHS